MRRDPLQRCGRGQNLCRESGILWRRLVDGLVGVDLPRVGLGRDLSTRSHAWSKAPEPSAQGWQAARAALRRCDTAEFGSAGGKWGSAARTLGHGMARSSEAHAFLHSSAHALDQRGARFRELLISTQHTNSNAYATACQCARLHMLPYSQKQASTIARLAHLGFADILSSPAGEEGLEGAWNPELCARPKRADGPGAA